MKWKEGLKGWRERKRDVWEYNEHVSDPTKVWSKLRNETDLDLAKEVIMLKCTVELSMIVVKRGHFLSLFSSPHSTSFSFLLLSKLHHILFVLFSNPLIFFFLQKCVGDLTRNDNNFCVFVSVWASVNVKGRKYKFSGTASRFKNFTSIPIPPMIWVFSHWEKEEDCNCWLWEVHHHRYTSFPSILPFILPIMLCIKFIFCSWLNDHLHWLKERKTCC